MLSIEDIIAQNKSSFVLSDNRLYQRAKRYADAAVKGYLETLHRTVEAGLAQTRSEIKAREREEIDKAVKRANSYFEKLENALSQANDLAGENKERHDAEFQADHDAWEQERDIFPDKHAEWEREASAKRRERDLWNRTNQSVLDAWEEGKRVYREEKERLEVQLAKLQDELSLIDGFRAEARREKKNKEIMEVKIELSRLRMPVEPDVPAAPTVPLEVTLREEPVRATLEELIEKESVLELFYSSMDWNMDEDEDEDWDEDEDIDEDEDMDEDEDWDEDEDMDEDEDWDEDEDIDEDEDMDEDWDEDEDEDIDEDEDMDEDWDTDEDWDMDEDEDIEED